ncbi:hypothetical protein QE408_000687 [Agrobacterium larrymoorei]|uniref:Uncharacterized protein n=1 Tax=Agrobacterium larrymoorei TaxID=160699 RepID=A0ABU0UF50_9HYPH|nr:hypothetical protein [Agrobacterium larrymoorei]
MDGNGDFHSQHSQSLLKYANLGRLVRIKNSACFLFIPTDASRQLTFGNTGRLKRLYHSQLEGNICLDRNRRSFCGNRFRKVAAFLKDATKGEAKSFTRIGKRFFSGFARRDGFGHICERHNETTIGIVLDTRHVFEEHVFLSFLSFVLRFDWWGLASIDAKLLFDQSHISGCQFAGFDRCHLTVELNPVVRTLSFVFEDFQVQLLVFGDLSKLSDELFALHFLSFPDFDIRTFYSELQDQSVINVRIIFVGVLHRSAKGAAE